MKHDALVLGQSELRSVIAGLDLVCAGRCVDNPAEREQTRTEDREIPFEGRRAL